jgi:integrase
MADDARRRNLDRLIEQIESGERGGDAADRDALLDFSDRLELHGSEYSVHRHEKLLRHCTIAAEGVGGLVDALEDREAAEDIVRWIHREYDNPETNKDYRIAIRMFGKRLAERNGDIDTDDNGVPESLAWVPSTTESSYNPKPDPTKMLDWEDDVKPMLDATMNARDAALIAVAWDAGPRTGELENLRVGDVSDHKHGLQITVDGRRGQRSIMLITAVPYLSRWLQDHPRRDDDLAPLWCGLENGSEVSYQMLRKAVREAASRADVTKPVTFTNFRKSSASYLASQGVNQAVLEDHHGWVRGSKVASRYVAVFGDASDREVARAHGVDVSDEEPEPIAAVTCPRCGEKTPREEPFCMWCHQAIEHGAVDEIEAEQHSKRRQLLGFAKEHPELIDRLEEIEPLVEAVGGDVDVIETARRFVDEAEADG